MQIFYLANKSDFKKESRVKVKKENEGTVYTILKLGHILFFNF